MSTSPVLIEKLEGGITVFSINRPERRNAICARTAIDLQNGFREFDSDPEQRVAVLTGSGDSFSAGADVSDPPELWRCVPTIGFVTHKPVIAAVGGWCIGGALILAMMSDLLVASEDAKFWYPEAKIGFTGGIIAGLAGRLPHKVAMEIMLLCKTVDAQRAYSVGFANEISPKGKHVDAAVAMARELSTMSPLVLQTIKRFVTESVLPKGPSEHMGRALRDLGVHRDSEDFQEGSRAFKEKRAPRFTGR